MKRPAKARRIGPMSWLLGTLFVGGGLTALFSLLAPERIAQPWPLGIRTEEVRLFGSVFDRRPVEPGNTLPEIFRFGGAAGAEACLTEQTGPRWRTRWFETDGYGDSVDVRHLDHEAGYLLRFKREAPLNGTRRLLLLPAVVEDIRLKYLELIAGELGLQTPGIGFVHLIGCGQDLGLYRKAERMDADLLERRGLTGASLVRMSMDPERPDLQFATIEGDSAERANLLGTLERALEEAHHGNTDALARLVDERSAIAWLLMAWVDGRDLRREPLWCAHQWSSGTLLPLYAAPTSVPTDATDAPVLYNVLTPLLRRPAFRTRFREAAEALVQKLPTLRERFAALDRAWLPVLAAEGALPFARTTAAHIADELLGDRLRDTAAVRGLDRPLVFGPGHATLLHGLPLPPVVRSARADTAGLRQLAKTYKLVLQGDSIIFPRGKYRIQGRLRFPVGHTVVMLQGARLFMGPGADLLCQGDLHILGTPRNPVFIRPEDEDVPFGTIAAVGNGSQRCTIGGLYLSGGAGATIDGVPHTAMLSIRAMARTVVQHSVFEESTAAASLHIQGGSVEWRNVRGEAGSSAVFALEHASGVLREVQVNHKAKSSVAEGLRIRSGQVAVVGARFTNVPGSALRIAGAAQLLVRSSTFTRGLVAVEAGERSIVHAEGNTFIGNAVVWQGGTSSGARFVLYPNTFTENTTERVLRIADVVDQRSALEEATAVSFGVPLHEAPPEVKKRGRRGGVK